MTYTNSPADGEHQAPGSTPREQFLCVLSQIQEYLGQMRAACQQWSDQDRFTHFTGELIHQSAVLSREVARFGFMSEMLRSTTSWPPAKGLTRELWEKYNFPPQQPTQEPFTVGDLVVFRGDITRLSRVVAVLPDRITVRTPTWIGDLEVSASPHQLVRWFARD